MTAPAWRAACVLALGLALAGCTSLWGDNPYRVTYSRPGAVIVQYDPDLITAEKVSEIADAECRLYEKQAVGDTAMRLVWGMATASYRCESPP